MKAVVVTGVSGGIGTEISELLRERNYFVIGVDQKGSDVNVDEFIKYNISDIAKNVIKYEELKVKIDKAIRGRTLVGLVNNAATQRLSSLEDIQIEDFKETLDVNLVAPLALSKMLFGYLKQSRGAIVNIGSIHSCQTKPHFISYACSKSGLEGLTRALSVDIGEYVRVNAIKPAAVRTNMLLEGFAYDSQKVRELEQYHPSCTIGEERDVAELVEFLLSSRSQFYNGMICNLDGGISSRLHDPT